MLGVDFPMGKCHIKVTGVIVRNFERNPLESSFVGVAQSGSIPEQN